MPHRASFPGLRNLASCAIPLAVLACGDDAETTGGGGATASTATSAGGGDATTASNSSGGPGAGGDTGPGAGGEGGQGAGQGGAGGAGQGGDTTSVGGGAPTEPVIVGGDRPVEVHIPGSYEHGEPTPLIVLLHGYSATGAIQNIYFGLSQLADEYGFLLAYPDGTVDTTGENFWNATPACCDFGGTEVDDSGYLQGVVDEASSVLSVDPKRIYFFGHSNGGFMSYRMACEHADSVAAIASLAGATYVDDGDCDPSEPVPVLQIHGTADTTILYAGGANFGNAYPGAEETVETWASYNGCDLSPAEGEPRDLSGNFPGDNSTVTTYDEGCDPHGGAELWTMTGESHTPIPLSETFTRQVVEWLYAHPKP